MSIIKMKKIIIMLMMVIVVLSFMSCSTKPKKSIVGNIITFGEYQWRVLAVQDDHALIITNEIIMRRAFDTISNIWEESEIRAYLNNDFYESFSEENRMRIRETSIQTEDRAHTSDKIFLLSTSEARTYFKDDNDRIASFNGQNDWWWLRSPGNYEDSVSSISHIGYIYLYGYYIFHTDGGVRPALWISLS